LHQDIKNIAILGSTGSIGTQALEVISANQLYLKPVFFNFSQSTLLSVIQQATS
jgi:1-deoxy-D-xylulose 5-phosphate reductoisomerase